MENPIKYYSTQTGDDLAAYPPHHSDESRSKAEKLIARIRETFNGSGIARTIEIWIEEEFLK